MAFVFSSFLFYLLIFSTCLFLHSLAFLRISYLGFRVVAQMNTLFCPFLSGVFNLTHRNGHSEGDIQRLTPHESFQVQFKLDSTAYKVSAGHKIRLALSSVHWPLVWPSPLVTSLSVQTGSPSMLLLPARIEQGRDAQLRAFETPGFYNHAVLPVEWRRNPRKAR